MRISLVTPAGRGPRNGNRHTALRWAAFLRAAGHQVSVSTEDTSCSADLMLALHARHGRGLGLGLADGLADGRSSGLAAGQDTLAG